MDAPANGSGEDCARETPQAAWMRRAAKSMRLARVVYRKDLTNTRALIGAITKLGYKAKLLKEEPHG